MRGWIFWSWEWRRERRWATLTLRCVDSHRPIPMRRWCWKLYRLVY